LTIIESIKITSVQIHAMGTKMKLLCKYFVLFLIIIFGLNRSCNVQSESLHFENIDIEEDLSSNCPFKIIVIYNGQK
jgi:hypothetical protein